MKTLALILLGLVTNAQSLVVKEKPVSKGEELQFKLSYGWFTIGRGTFKISDNYVMQDGKECIEINVHGRTAGLAGVFSKVDDRWGAVIDKNTLLPYYSYRDLSEGYYDLDEKVYFDYDSMEVRVESSSASDVRPTKYFDLEKGNYFDMMGGLMYARSIDYRGLEKGDTIQLEAFFDKKFYDFRMVYHGIEMTKTKVGDIYCHKVVPIMQENSVFDGKNAVRFWISADANRLPLKVAADMNFGTAYCELTAYKNVKSGIDFE
ncbi:DUF3108 domain-containing protein [Ekhidna sp.]|uniref:DUF3108 domain-containing protein n=1 Tax=Ekhidna sp. TaxID=2608089 RepID=UPI00329891C5